MARWPLAVVLVAAAAGCGGEAEVVPESTTFISVVVSTTEGPTPNGAPIASEGDVGPVVAALQWLLNCGGHGDLTEDGVFGPATSEAVSGAQATLRRERTGKPDAETFAILSRACDATRPIGFIDGVPTVAVAGNAAPGDPDTYLVDLVDGYEVTARVDQPETELSVAGPDGSEIHPADGSRAVTFSVEQSGEHLITVIAAAAADYTLSIAVPVRVSGLDEPIPTDTVDAMLAALFESVERGDLAAAMTAVPEEAAFHGVGEETEGAAGRTSMLASLARLAAEHTSWESLGVDSVEGEIITFTALGGEGEDQDQVPYQFGARIVDGLFAEWWVQAQDAEGRLAQLFDRAAADDLDGAMTLVAPELAFHGSDGSVTEGADGREALRSLLGDGHARVLDELRSFDEGVAAFAVSTVAADPEPEFYSARFEGAIVEWWVEPSP